MDERAWLTRYAAQALIVVGGLEWLLGRVVSRFAAIPPLEGIGRTIVEVLGRAGIFLLSTSFILATTLFLLSTLRLGATANRSRDAGGLALAIYLTIFSVFLSAHATFTVFSVFEDAAWLNVTFNVLSLVAAWWVALRFIFAAEPPGVAYVRFALKLGVLLAVMAYSGWYYSVLYSWLSGTSPAGSAGPVEALYLGELAAVLVPMALFVAVAVPGGAWRNLRRWIAPLVVLLIFAAGNLADIAFNQGYTGVFAIWSVGFTLYLPWPLYSVSLALYLYAVITCFSRIGPGPSGYSNTNIGLGMLLLFFASFYLQLTYQHLLALLALLLLTGISRPFDGVREATTSDIYEGAAPETTTT